MRHRPCTWGARCKYRHDVPVPEGPPQVVHVECNVHMLPLKRKNPFEHGKNTAHGEGMMTAAEGERAASSTVEQDSEDGERYVPMTYNFVEQLCRVWRPLGGDGQRRERNEFVHRPHSFLSWHPTRGIRDRCYGQPGDAARTSSGPGPKFEHLPRPRDPVLSLHAARLLEHKYRNAKRAVDHFPRRL